MKNSINKICKMADNYYKLSNETLVKEAIHAAAVAAITLGVQLLLPLLNEISNADSVISACDKILSNLKSSGTEMDLEFTEESSKKISSFLSAVSKIKDSMLTLSKYKNTDEESLKKLVEDPMFVSQFLNAEANFNSGVGAVDQGLPYEVAQILTVARGAAGTTFDMFKGMGLTLGMGTMASNSLKGIEEFNKFMTVARPDIQNKLKAVKAVIKNIQGTKNKESKISEEPSKDDTESAKEKTSLKDDISSEAEESASFSDADIAQFSNIDLD